MPYALCSLLFKVDTNLPVAYSMQQREAGENRGSLRALIFGMSFGILMTSEDGTLLTPCFLELTEPYHRRGSFHEIPENLCCMGTKCNSTGVW